jgi:hypothetical protein
VLVRPFVALLSSFRGTSVTPSERYFLSTRLSNLVSVLAFLLFGFPHCCHPLLSVAGVYEVIRSPELHHYDAGF